VADEFDAILRFWLERGVDGFRIDVAHGLVKHHDLLDNPEAPEHERLTGTGRAATAQLLERVYDLDQPGVLHVYRRWRTVVERTARGCSARCTCATRSGSPATFATTTGRTCRSGASPCRSPGTRRPCGWFWPARWRRPPAN
jgi:alpha-glucosidase